MSNPMITTDSRRLSTTIRELKQARPDNPPKLETVRALLKCFTLHRGFKVSYSPDNCGKRGDA